MLTETAKEPAGISESQRPPMPWFRVWITALTRPNPKRFADLARAPDVKTTRAFLWVFLAGSFDYFAAIFVRAFIVPVIYGGSSTSVVAIPNTSAGWLCAFPVYGVVFLLAFMLMVALIQATAKVLGGSGAYVQLAFVLGALAAPFSIITAILLPLVAIPYMGLCFSLLTIIISFYILGLQVPAIKGVHQFGWGKASLALLLPGLVLGVPALCILSAF